jgi:hypothetical protein
VAKSEAKYKRCKEAVARQGGKYNPYAVCAKLRPKKKGKKKK